MISVRGSRANRACAPAADAGYPRSPFAAIGSLIAKGWRAYRDWHVRRTTILILRSLDRRMLHDIGIDPSEIESLAYDVGRERRRRHGGSRTK